MRDLDNRNIVSGDFLVVAGDVVSNAQIQPALTKHRARREKDKNAIMTMMLCEGAWTQRLMSKRRKPLFVIDPQAERCLYYEEIGGRGASKYVNLDPDFVSSHAVIDVREDLLDPHVDICTPDVLALWTENFDYQSLRKSFLYGVLKDHELNGKTIHTHIIPGDYAARVDSLRTYHSITQDVVSKMVFPFCPDSNLLPGQTYRSLNGEIYREEKTRVAHTSKISRNCVIGADSSLGDNVTLSNSILGRHCRIGSGSSLSDAILWDNATVGDNVKVIGPTITGYDVKIDAHATIHPGSIIVSGVNVAESTEVKEGQILKPPDSTQTEQVASDDSDVSSEASLRLTPYKSPSASASQSSISTFASSEDGYEPRSDTSRRSSFVSDHSEENSAAKKDFLNEATASILDGLTKGDAVDTIFLELNGYRMSVDASQHQVRQAAVTAFATRISQLCERASAREAVKGLLGKYVSLFERMVLDKDLDEKGDQVDLLLLIQKAMAARSNGEQLLLFTAKELYDLDILEEEGVFQWWDHPESSNSEMGKVRQLTEQFITFLKEAEEDEDSEEEEDSE